MEYRHLYSPYTEKLPYLLTEQSKEGWSLSKVLNPNTWLLERRTGNEQYTYLIQWSEVVFNNENKGRVIGGEEIFSIILSLTDSGLTEFIADKYKVIVTPLHSS